ncbi:hypothetical protein FQR65_LT21012 [Abscondita terminalis]|nr:hypothetical protein FQR65_LT21012 [Abscondita terminalis]
MPEPAYRHASNGIRHHPLWPSRPLQLQATDAASSDSAALAFDRAHGFVGAPQLPPARSALAPRASQECLVGIAFKQFQRRHRLDSARPKTRQTLPSDFPQGRVAAYRQWLEHHAAASSSLPVSTATLLKNRRPYWGVSTAAKLALELAASCAHAPHNGCHLDVRLASQIRSQGQQADRSTRIAFALLTNLLNSLVFIFASILRGAVARCAASASQQGSVSPDHAGLTLTSCRPVHRRRGSTRNNAPLLIGLFELALELPPTA